MRIKQLKQARDLISDKNKWCQGASAVDENDNSVTIDSAFACKWCLEGACRKYGVSLISPEWDILKEINKTLFGTYAPYITNDTVGHDAVLKLLDATIERIEKNESPRR